MTASDKDKRYDPELRQAISDKLRADREHLDQARVHIDFAIAELQKLQITKLPFAASLYPLSSSLAWHVKFLKEDTTDPKSIYVHNLAAFSE